MLENPFEDAAMQRSLITIFLLCLSLSVGAGIYSWKDKDGNIHFGDHPPVAAPANEVDIRVNAVSTPDYVRDSSRRYVEDLGRNRPLPKGKGQKVVMYSASWCGVCKRARRYFNEKHVPFKEYDIDRSARGRRQYEKYNTGSVPVIAVGKRHMTGFSPAGFQRLYGSVE
jgi:glutaredoxin